MAFGPTPERPVRITPWGDGDAAEETFSLEALAEAVERAQEVDLLDENLRRLLTAGSSLGGARPKGSTELDGQPWIAKFPARDDTFPVCRIELATMRLAAECGLDVPPLNVSRGLRPRHLSHPTLRPAPERQCARSHAFRIRPDTCLAPMNATSDDIATPISQRPFANTALTQ